MTDASSNRTARKKSESESVKPYFATTKPELQITINIQGAAPTNLFIGVFVELVSEMGLRQASRIQSPFR